MSNETRQNPIKVLMVAPSGLIFAFRQAKALRDLGIDVDEFYISSRDNIFSLIKDFFALRGLMRLRHDLVHAQYGTMTSFFSAVASAAISVPMVVTFRGSDLNYVKSDGIFRNIIGKILSYISAARARAIICVSPALSQKLFWRKHIMNIIPNGVDTGVFYPMDRDKARKTLGWNIFEKVVVFNANNPKVKRLDIAQKAIGKAQEKIPEIRLEILTGVVSQEKMPLYLNAADCLLLCSDSEGSPNIVKEALACNLPIVSVDVGDARERLVKVAPSMIVEKNSDALAQALAEILSAPRRSNGCDAIKRDRISQEDVAGRILTVYKSVCR